MSRITCRWRASRVRERGCRPLCRMGGVLGHTQDPGSTACRPLPRSPVPPNRLRERGREGWPRGRAHKFVSSWVGMAALRRAGHGGGACEGGGGWGAGRRRRRCEMEGLATRCPAWRAHGGLSRTAASARRGHSLPVRARRVLAARSHSCAWDGLAAGRRRALGRGKNAGWGREP